ncbi:MAG: TerC family protein [Nitrospirota bacterium]|nr:TerC family protein [Nitrospirota bacterium]
MLSLLVDPEAWISLATLTVLEIVLGIDNIIFLSIVSSRLPRHQQPTGRRIGLCLALLGRLFLLFSIAWMTRLTAPLFIIAEFVVSWRDIVLAAGGLFLLYKGTHEMHQMMEGNEGDAVHGTATFAAVMVQIVLIDMVFSLDSVITAVGIADHVPVMATAIVLAMIVMLIAAEPIAKFVDEHPTVKMLALSFLLLVGVALVADGAHFHIPRAYLYFAISFSIGVEALNLMVARARERRTAKEAD